MHLTALRSRRQHRITALAILLCLVVGLTGSLSVLPVLHTAMEASGLLGGEQPIRIMAEDGRGRYSIPPSADWIRSWQRERDCCHELGAVVTSEAALRTHDGARKIPVLLASAEFLRAFDVRPIAGGSLGESSKIESESTALVTASFARTHFGDASRAIGNDIVLDGLPRTILGVVPSNFAQRVYPGVRFEVVLPLDLADHDLADVFGVVKPGIAVARVEEELSSLILGASPMEQATDSMKPAVVPANEFLGSRGRSVVRSAVFAGAILVLVTCVSVAHLLFALMESQRLSMATRWALGATRWRLVRAWLLESLTFAGLAGSLSFGLAQLVLGRLTTALPAELHWLADVELGTGAWLGGLASSFLLLAGLGTLPMLRTRTSQWSQALRTHQPESPRRRRAFLDLPLVSMAALSTLLVVGAYLVLGSIHRIGETRLGFESENVYALHVNLPRWEYPEVASRTQVFEELSSRIDSLPATSVAMTSLVPSEKGFYFGQIELSGDGVDVPALAAVSSASVSPGYFRVLDQELLAGREFEAADTYQQVLVISESVARYMGLEPAAAVGRRARLGGNDAEIVGVVRNENVPGRNQTIDLKFYRPLKNVRHELTLLVRAERGLDSRIRSLVQEISPDIVVEVAGLRELLRDAVSDLRFLATIFSALTAMVVVLVMLGVFSVQNRFAATRQRELALRTALGADRGRLLRWFVGKCVFSTVVGGVIGIAGSYPLSQWIATQLHGIQPGDLMARMLAAGVVLAATALASWAPASRATRADPSQLLKAG